jgi:hypothetical protein
MNSANTVANSQTVRCLAYYSRGVRHFENAELQEILQRSRFNNSRVGVTGMLVYVKGRFFQLLEGPSAAVLATFDRIGRDPRHADVAVLKDFTTTSRHFPAWTMGFPSPNAEILTRMGGYSNLRQPGSQDLARRKAHSRKIFDRMRSIGSN